MNRKIETGFCRYLRIYFWESEKDTSYHVGTLIRKKEYEKVNKLRVAMYIRENIAPDSNNIDCFIDLGSKNPGHRSPGVR